MGLALTAGDVLRGKYRLEQVLGRGGMGTVHLATHLVIGQRVAIKIVNRTSPSDHAYVVARFVREARAAALLESEHVVRILDVDEVMEDGPGDGPRATPFMVMEYLHGSDLGAILRKGGRLPLPEAIDYVLQACEALAEAHAVGIVHRDLKPSNLFRAETAARKEPIIKLLDFGISKLSTPGEDLSLTDTQAVIGSPLFMSPEQLLSSRDVDHRTDIWSLGVTLYQLAAGALPFEASSASALGAQIAARSPRALSAVLPEVPRDLEAVVMRCLARAPEDRFSDVVSLARALGACSMSSWAASGDTVAAVVRAAERGARGRPPASLNSEAPPAPSAVEASGERWTQSRVATGSDEEQHPRETQSRERRSPPLTGDQADRDRGIVPVHGTVALSGSHGSPRSVTGPPAAAIYERSPISVTGPTAPPHPHLTAAVTGPSSFAPAGSIAGAPSTAAPPPIAPRRSPLVAIAIVIVLLFAASGITVFVMNKKRHSEPASSKSVTSSAPAAVDASSSPSSSSTGAAAQPPSSSAASSANNTIAAPSGSVSAPKNTRVPGGGGVRPVKPGTTWSKDPSELELK